MKSYVAFHQVFTVCQSTFLLVSRMKRVYDSYSINKLQLPKSIICCIFTAKKLAENHALIIARIYNTCSCIQNDFNIPIYLIEKHIQYDLQNIRLL